MDEKKYRVLNRDPKPGDLIRLTARANYTFNQPGDILPVCSVKGSTNSAGVAARQHPRQTGTCAEYVWFYSPEEYEVVEEILPGGFKVGDRVRIKPARVSTNAPLFYGGQTGTLECYDGTDYCPWRVQLDKLLNCIWVPTDEPEPLPEPGYNPDDVKLTRPAESDEDDEDGVTLEEIGNLPALEFLHSVRDCLQKVTFTADGDLIAEFK